MATELTMVEEGWRCLWPGVWTFAKWNQRKQRMDMTWLVPEMLP